MKFHNYFVYIVTNPNKRVLYAGMTNNLEQRIIEHYLCRGSKTSFASKYYCYCLVFFERFQFVKHAIAREKQIKGWIRKKKKNLIEVDNPEWRCLNKEIMEWPPQDASLRSARQKDLT